MKNFPGIDCRFNKDGSTTYRARCRYKGHTFVSKTFKNLTLAKKWKRETDALIQQDLYLAHSKAEKHTLCEAIDRYCKEVLPHKPKNAKNVLCHLARWKKDLGHLRLNRVTPATLSEVREKLLSESVPSGNQRSNTTVVRYLASLSHVLSTATIEWLWLKENPVLKVRKPKQSRGRVRFLSEEEFPRLLDSCKASNNLLLYPIVMLALTTGMRSGEVLKLKWQDIDLSKGRLTLYETKNGEIRVVAIPSNTVKVLEAFYQSQLRLSPLLFPGTDPTKPIDFRSAWRFALKRAKITDFVFHDLRHTFASYLVMSGASLAEVAEALGHKTLAMVKRYAHLSECHLGGVVEKMNKRFFR